MTDPKSLVSVAFRTFSSEAPEYAQAWSAMVQKLAEVSALDRKTASLAYLAVLAVRRAETGIRFHAVAAKQAGASREEVISAVLLGLPVAGSVVTQVLPATLAAYDAE